MDLRSLATDLLKVGAWLNLAVGVVFALYFWRLDLIAPVDPYGAPTPVASMVSAMRIGGIIGSLLGGAVGWAVCYVLAEVSRESRELHHQISRAME